MNLKKIKEPFVMILIGPPLSGKSTWIRENFKDIPVTIVSRDQLVLDLSGSDDYNIAFDTVNQKDVDRALLKQMNDAVSNKENVIIDMTHMTSKRRMHNLSFFTDDYYKVAVIFPILDEEEYLRRDKIRAEDENKSISLDIINRMIASYRPITDEEGFDKVISI